ncbi:ATP-dependent carboxylate-amine ligase [Candidatus Micrarchaeota archaeon]|nr:MAG: ATP-dependent carboxylate-amine ligase [Candidatus Micrarchaeota archaeon]
MGSVAEKWTTILITGGGAPGIAGTIYALRNNPHQRPFRILVVDIQDDVVGKYLADGFIQVPPPESDEYLPSLLQIVKREGISVILPQTTREVARLSKSIETLASTGVAVVVSSAQSIEIANDKFLLLQKAEETGVPYPAYHRTDSKTTLLEAVELLGYPQKKVVVKPRVSNGMRGLRILSEEPWTVERFLAEKPEGIEISLDDLTGLLSQGKWPELLVSEYLPGDEYTTDVFSDGHEYIVIPRLREKIRSGITFNARVDLRQDLVEYSSKLAKVLDLRYCFGFQFKLSEEGIPKLLECNPRVQGTMVASVFAGFNVIYYAVAAALGSKIKLDKTNLKDGLKFKRYWGGVATDEGKPAGKV